MFDNRTIEPRVFRAIKFAKELLHPDSKMMKELWHKNDFEYNSGLGQEICEKIVFFTEPTKVFFFKSKNPWSKSFGYFNNVDSIFINTRKFNELCKEDEKGRMPGLIGFLCHERLHHVGFSHGNNFKTKHKCLYSVNYFVSENIERWL